MYAWRGENDLAFEWLARANTLRDTGLTLIRHDPLLDRIRSDPRFAALLRKMKPPA